MAVFIKPIRGLFHFYKIINNLQFSKQREVGGALQRSHNQESVEAKQSLKLKEVREHLSSARFNILEI